MNNAKRKDMFEPISEDLYKELWSNMLPGYYEKSLKIAQTKGYVQESSEDEIRNELEKIKYFDESGLDNIQNWMIRKDKLKTDLINILDNQIKELRK